MERLINVIAGKRGFTLVEVLVAIIVLIFGLMALFTAVILSMNKNVENNIRDAAVRLAEERMNEVRATTPVPHAWACAPRTLNLGNITLNANVCDTLTVVGTMSQITVVVGWDYGRGTASQTPTGRTFQHSITSIQ